MIKNALKIVIRSVGLNPTTVANTFRSSWLGIALNSWRISKLVKNNQARNHFIYELIKEFNPDLTSSKPAGTLRIGLLWDRRDRFKWLGYANDDKNCEIVRMRIAMFKPIWWHYLRDYLKDTVAEQNMGEYPLDTYFKAEYDKGKAVYHQYCKDVVSFIKETYNIDVFLLPKLNDDWAIEIVRAFRAAGVPLVIDDREGANTKKRLEIVPPRLRQLFDEGIDFDLLCAHNTAHKELFMKSGFDPDKIIINGAPESDYWSNPHLWPALKDIDPRLQSDKILVLIFAFGPRNFLHFYYGNEKRDWTQLGEDYHEVILQLLEKYGDRIQIAYKLGGQTARDRFNGYEAFAKKVAPYEESGAFVELRGSVNSFDLLVNADVTIGFQTSGLTEAMFLDKPIICGGWGDLYNEIKDTLLPFHTTKALTFVDSKERMWEVLDLLLENLDTFTLTDEMGAARKEFRESFFYNPDGNVSRRLLGYVKEVATGQLPRSTIP